MTPGGAIAQTIAERLDVNGDGVFLPGEAETYGRSLVADSRSPDRRRAVAALWRVEVPVASQMREGPSRSKPGAIWPYGPGAIVSSCATRTCR
jgi:hypothetical protein